jgi:hypothetical protein
VVKVKERNQAWIRPRTAQVGSDVDALELSAEQSRGKTACPLVEVPQHDPRSMKLQIVQDFWAD